MHSEKNRNDTNKGLRGVEKCLGGRRAECGCSFGPGVVRIAICSLVRLGEGWNFVQFIVLMEWITFQCTEVVHREDPKNSAQIGPPQHAFEIPGAPLCRLTSCFWRQI